MGAASVVQVSQDLFYVLLQVLFYLWTLLKRLQQISSRLPPSMEGADRWGQRGYEGAGVRVPLLCWATRRLCVYTLRSVSIRLSSADVVRQLILMDVDQIATGVRPSCDRRSRHLGSRTTSCSMRPTARWASYSQRRILIMPPATHRRVIYVLFYGAIWIPQQT